jgi:multiple sugar transport system ATP-binding protein
VVLGIRPEAVDISAEPTGLSMIVELVEELGADAFVYGSIPGEQEGTARMVARPTGRMVPRIGESVDLAIDSRQEHAFNPLTGERIG